MQKINLQDVTFLMTIRIDSMVRLENIMIVVNNILTNFDTSIILLHADNYDNGILKKMLSCSSIQYIFKEDHDNVFHRTKYINETVRLATTPYVAVWDADVIVPKNQIIQAVQKLRDGYDAAYPFKHFLDTSSIVRELYLKTRDINTLQENCDKMKMIYGPNVKGGAFIINKNAYQRSGLENELFYGWGIEDGDRYVRWTELDYNIYIGEGYLFHLTHGRGINSEFRNYNQNKFFRKMYNITKSSSKDEIMTRINIK